MPFSRLAQFDVCGDRGCSRHHSHTVPLCSYVCQFASLRLVVKEEDEEEEEGQQQQRRRRRRRQTKPAPAATGTTKRRRLQGALGHRIACQAVAPHVLAAWSDAKRRRGNRDGMHYSTRILARCTQSCANRVAVVSQHGRSAPLILRCSVFAMLRFWRGLRRGRGGG